MYLSHLRLRRFTRLRLLQNNAFSDGAPENPQLLSYVWEVVLKGCVERARVRVWTRAWNHATFQNDFPDISYRFVSMYLISRKSL